MTIDLGGWDVKGRNFQNQRALNVLVEGEALNGDAFWEKTGMRFQRRQEGWGADGIRRFSSSSWKREL